jgi:CP family cyanate transporter-like MFS transporter
VLVPSIVKLKYPERIGIITSIYITSIAIFASIGAGASYPLASSGLGWKAASVVWSGIAILAVFAWMPQRNLGPGTLDLAGGAAMTADADGGEIRKIKKNGKSIWKSPLAWYITLFMGFQSLNYYSLTAWLPSILESSGMGQWADLAALAEDQSRNP